MTRYHALACGLALTLALPAPPSLAATPSATAPSNADQRLREAIDTGQPQAIALLERLVNQNSGTLNLAGVKAVADMVRAELVPLGFDVQWIDKRDTGRAGHLIATHRGNGRGKRILLIGHLDTVFEPDSPFQRFVRNGDSATGPGIADDKGGVVVILSALRALHATGQLGDADIQVVLTGDEESAGEPVATARAELIAAGRWADVALEYEGLIVSDGREYATVARRSVADWVLTANGLTGHSSDVFGASLGYGANYELARILDAFRRELPEPNLSLNVGLMVGGTPATLDPGGAHGSASGKTNIIAEQAVATGDLRALTPQQEASARARMQAIVQQHLPKTRATLVFADAYPPMAPTAGNRAVLALLNQVNTDLGLPPMGEWDPAKRGAADSSFVAADADVLAGLGASGDRAHAEGESIDLASIPRQALRSAALIARLARMPR